MPYKNPQKKKERSKAHYFAIKEKRLEQMKAWNKANKKKRKGYNKAYRLTHKEKRNELKRLWYRKKLANNPSFKLRHNLRNLLNKSLRKKNNMKYQPTFQYLGCTLQWFTTVWWPNKINAWNEAYPGHKLNLDSCGIHLDHIKPVRAFEDNEMHECFHYTNLQPLPAVVNGIKSDTWTWDDETHWRCNILYNDTYVDPYIPVDVNISNFEIEQCDADEGLKEN